MRFGRRPDRKTVARVLEDEPIPLRIERRFPPYTFPPIFCRRRPRPPGTGVDSAPILPVVDLARGVLVSVPHKLEVPDMVRVLITVEPRMYREALALAVQSNRPDAEVLLTPEGIMDGRVEGFAPHVLVRNDGDGAVPEELLRGVVCRVEVLYTDHMSTRVSLPGGRSFTIEDVCMDDLLALVDEVEVMVS